MKLRNCLVFISVLLFCCSFSPAQTRLSLAFGAGFGSIKVGDINTTLISTNAAYDGLRNSAPGAVAGEYLPMPTGFRDWQAELRWNAWGRFSIGIAISAPLHFSNFSALTHTWFGHQSGLPQTMNNTVAPDVHVSAPVSLNFCYTVPIITRINLIARGGMGYYRARIEQTWSRVDRNPDESTFVGQQYFSVKGKHIGYEGGIALEYVFNKRISLMMAGVWRFAKIGSFEGSWQSHLDSFDGYGSLTDTQNVTEEGFLYHYIGDSFYVDARHEKLILSSFFPEYGIDMPFGQRKAFLDLGGFTLRIGVKIGLF